MVTKVWFMDSMVQCMDHGPKLCLGNVPENIFVFRSVVCGSVSVNKNESVMLRPSFENPGTKIIT